MLLALDQTTVSGEFHRIPKERKKKKKKKEKVTKPKLTVADPKGLFPRFAPSSSGG